MKTFLWIKAERSQIRPVLEHIQQLEGFVEAVATGSGLYAIVALFNDDDNCIAKIKALPGVTNVDVFKERIMQD